MLVTIHQPEHLPWLGFLNKADQADLLVLLDVVQFRTNYFQNRNRILTAQGIAWLTVPVLTKGHIDGTLADLQINNGDRRWAERCWKTIQLSYHKHPFFERYAAFLEETYSRPWERLVDLNEHLIRWLFQALGIRTPVVRASELHVQGASSQLLLDICLATGATSYLAGQLAGNYLDESLFAAHGVAVRHHDFHHPTYQQHGRAEFTSHLSGMDLLFNCGEESLGIVREGSRDSA